MPPTRAALSLALLAACAAPPRTTWSEALLPEVFVEVLPRDALVAVDGLVVGPGSRPVPVPDPARTYVLQASARGYATAERAADGAHLAGARVALVLRPDGFGEARRLDYDDAASLTAAALLLLRVGRHGEAQQYAQRAAELAPEAPLPRRALGDAAWALGQKQRAIQEYSAYLAGAPGAPDRRAIERRVEGLRGDIVLPGARP